MRRISSTAILLTLIMFLTLFGAAVVFLYQDNQALEKQTVDREATRTALSFARDRLSSEVAIRESLQTAAEATRDSLESRNSSLQGELHGLQRELGDSETALTEAEAALKGMGLQLSIFSPEDGQLITPEETVELVIAARAGAGIDSILLSINDEMRPSYEGLGREELLIRENWTPIEEGDYTITAAIQDLQGQTRQPVTAVVTVAYSSPEAREAAILEKVEQGAAGLRFPEPAQPISQTAAQAEAAVNLHLRLLTGADSYSGTEVISDSLVLRAFDFIPSGYSLENFANSAAGLVGYPDPEGGPPSTFDPAGSDGVIGRWLHIHDHAHTMQVEKLNLTPFSVAALDSDAMLARRALVEGDAAFLHYLVTQSEVFDPEAGKVISDTLAAIDDELLDTAPPYLRDSFALPYQAGYQFIRYLYDRGGYPAVDAAWSNPPRSTEQILHPERFVLTDAPIEVTLLPVEPEPGDQWSLVAADTFGEWQLRQYLQQALTAGQAEAAADGWAGGRYAVYQSQTQNTLLNLLRLAWDSTVEREQFEAAFNSYLNNRYNVQGLPLRSGGRCWQNGDVTCLFPLGDDSLIIRAPDLTTALSVADGQQAGLSS